MELTNWIQLQPSGKWSRRITPAMLTEEGETIDRICKLIGERTERYRTIVFDKTYALEVMDRTFQNLTKEQAKSLFDEWLHNGTSSEQAS